MRAFHPRWYIFSAYYFYIINDDTHIKYFINKILLLHYILKKKIFFFLTENFVTIKLPSIEVNFNSFSDHSGTFKRSPLTRRQVTKSVKMSPSTRRTQINVVVCCFFSDLVFNYILTWRLFYYLRRKKKTIPYHTWWYCTDYIIFIYM